MLKINQLHGRLAGRLDFIYLVAGEEPLLVQEAADAVRAKARQAGCEERQVLTVEPGFDWRRLRGAGANLSLFASMRLIELRLGDAGPGTDGGKALQNYAAEPPPDTVLLVTAGSLDRKARSAHWFRSLDAAGAAAYAWPVRAGELPGWSAGRMRGAGLQPTEGAARELARLTEGNLLAAAQGVRRLALLYPDGRITPSQVHECVADNARFDVFAFADKLLGGRIVPVLRSLDRLREEDVMPVLVLWAVTRELRGVAAVARRVEAGVPMEQALNDEKVMFWRKELVGQAAKRLGERGALELLQDAARADRVIKGEGARQPWEELLNLCLHCSGIEFRVTDAPYG